MLRKLLESELDSYIDDIYEIALDPSRSGYPIYTDLLKTKEILIEYCRRSFQRPLDEMLVFETDEQIEGYILYEIEEKTITNRIFNFYHTKHIASALEEFIEYVSLRYPGYELILAFPGENQKALEYIQARDFQILQIAYNNTFLCSEVELRKTDEHLVAVNQKNFALFASLHAMHDEDMWWNNARLWESLDRWHIYMYMENEQVMGAIVYHPKEVFAVDFINDEYNSQIYKACMTQAMNDCKKAHQKGMTMFADSLQEVEDLRDLGFHFVGMYHGYVCQL